MIGTLINVATILAGSLIGLLLGTRLPERVKALVITSVSIITIVMGVSSALKTENLLIPFLALVIGSVLGELITIDKGVAWLGDWLKQRFARGGGKEKDFTFAFVVASLQFGIGPLAILGALNDGLTGDFSLLTLKSVLDGFTSLILASGLGPGVIFAALTMLIYQGGISLFAGLMKPLFLSAPELPMASQPRLIELAATGGLILIALGLNMAQIKQIKVANMLPALLIAPLLVALLNLFHLPLDFGLGGK